ncbi:9100_t:CDS:2 [Cetraspora pellucida]|uniref:9100_t:CDS:1 n=1 Tax=Cetraspora pellucida TaxID=1433469 RepID=A0ACA9JVS1_9GLOM|nr:9100_t:CDS:2 [Cetraspora pellucida]
MAFHQPHRNRLSRGPSSDRELELEQVNQALRNELSNKVSINKLNEKYINELERKYTRCENEIQSLNKELERLENASEKEKAELRSEISEAITRIRRAEEEDIDMANLDLFIQIEQGLYRIEKHLRGGTPLNNPINIIEERNNSQNNLALMTTAYNNERTECCRWWFSYRDKNRRVGELIREKFAIQLLLQRCYTNNRDLQQRPEASFSANILSTISQPETSSHQLQTKSIILVQSQQKRSNSDDYPRVPDKYMPKRPSDGYGVNSERFIHADIINPIPSTSQIMESLANNLYKKLSDMFLAKLVQSKNKDTSIDDINEITKVSKNSELVHMENALASKDDELKQMKDDLALNTSEIHSLKTKLSLELIKIGSEADEKKIPNSISRTSAKTHMSSLIESNTQMRPSLEALPLPAMASTLMSPLSVYIFLALLIIAVVWFVRHTWNIGRLEAPLLRRPEGVTLDSKSHFFEIKGHKKSDRLRDMWSDNQVLEFN